MPVAARISLITLGVRDVARSTAFYSALGWRPSSSSVDGEVSFFATAGARLALFGDDDLVADTALVAVPPTGFRGVTLAINVDSAAAVDSALAEAETAGGTIAKPGAIAEWGGYSGYFADPDGHLWEVAHNPFWPLDADGLPVLP
jgi:catechol 2,3-dioxygenase-like lactoylglutathione lyase family enzyme